MSESKNNKNAKGDKKQQKTMELPREMIPVMKQNSGPLGSYTGMSVNKFNPFGEVGGTPEQDADDL